MDSFHLIDLVFGVITSAGVLYALLTPTSKKHFRKSKIKKIIKQELDDNYETVNAFFFEDGFENVDESKITIGDLLMCSIELRDSSWKMLRNEASELFNPQVFVTINDYYYQVDSIIEIANRMKNQGIVDDERVIKLKDHISFIEFEFVLWVAIDVIIQFTDKYQKMLKGDKEVYK